MASLSGSSFFLRHLPFALVAGTVGLAAVACGGADTIPASDEKGDSGTADAKGFGQDEPDPVTDTKCAQSSRSAKRAVVDFIISVDTSASMADEIKQVRASINAFAKSVGNTGLDYNVIVVAERGDPFGLCVPEPLASPGCGDAERFHHLNVDIQSWDLLNALIDQYNNYSHWLRQDAWKVFIVVSDDDAHLSSEAFDKLLLDLPGGQFGTATNRHYVFDSICGYTRGQSYLSNIVCGNAKDIGAQYQQLSQLTGGTIDSVCEKDYGPVFDNLTKGIITKLGCEFAYPKAQAGVTTDPTKVIVTYTPGDGATAQALTQVTDESKCSSYANAWYYDDNDSPTKIVFCPSTCSGPGNDPAGKLDVAVDCVALAPK